MKKIFTSGAFVLIAFVCYAQTPLIDSLLVEASKHTRDTNELKVLSNLSMEFARRDFGRAKSYAWQQIALSRTLGTTFLLSSSYASLVGAHQNGGLIDSAQFYVDELAAL